MKFKRIGIIGGMGPESTALLYKYIIKLCQKKFNSFRDEDFPEIIIYNLPIPDITKLKTKERNVRKELDRAILLFEFAKVNLIAFPCNSLSYFTDYLKKKTHIPIINIVEETAKHITLLNADKITIFATETTIKKKLYNQYLKSIIIHKPKNQKEVTFLIQGVMKGKGIAKNLHNLIYDFIRRKEYVVLGCTDLSVLAEKIKSKYVIDSLKILAKYIVDSAVYNSPHPHPSRQLRPEEI